MSPIATGTAKHTAFTRVSTPTSKQTPGVTATTTQGVTATPTNTATATATATATPDPTPDPTADPTPPPPVTVVANFSGGPYAVTTTYSYSGTVSIAVSGEGQASQTQYSDALYRYTDIYGNATTPTHPSCWVLYINDKPVDDFITTSIPAYQSSHSYSFTINAPGGQLTFGVCDSITSDNTGSYTITVTQQ